MKRRKNMILIGGAILLLCAAAMGWHAWLTRPITIMEPPLEAGHVATIRLDDRLGLPPCIVNDPDDIERAVEFLNQLTVRRTGTYNRMEECSGYMATVYLKSGPYTADSYLGGGWNSFYLNGPELFYDGVRYEVLDNVGNLLLTHLLQSGESKIA